MSQNGKSTVTTRGSVPIFDGTGPYQQVPFQFSLHLQAARGGEVVHHEYLAEPGVDHFSCRDVELRPADPPARRRPRAGLFPLDIDGDALGDACDEPCPTCDPHACG